MNKMSANDEYLVNALREHNFQVTFRHDGDVLLYWQPGDPASSHFLGYFHSLLSAYWYAGKVFQLLNQKSK